MKPTVVTEHELSERSGVNRETIARWIKSGLLPAEGRSNSGVAFLPEQTIERVSHIQQLLELGYQEEAVGKILRKVGVPNSERVGTNKNDGSHLLTVGALAESVGVSARTLKHWEDKGIIEADARSEGGFRLFQNHYVYLCHLILDLQLFGYSLEQIKRVSDYFRDFLAMRNDISTFDPARTREELDEMTTEIDGLFKRTAKLREGIERWEKLLNKQKRLIIDIRKANARRATTEGNQ